VETAVVQALLVVLNLQLVTSIRTLLAMTEAVSTPDAPMTSRVITIHWPAVMTAVANT
jgi:hypothetical protein